MQHSFNPDVSVRPKGVVEKCTFCHHRLIKAKEEAKAQGRALRQEDYVPACVQICPSNAMYFGDLDDENGTVWRLTRSPRAFKLLEDLGIEPKVIYLSEEKAHA
jgi:molybdopterin-containing oxidoreductase family iron-sulfur binding subunit